MSPTIRIAHASYGQKVLVDFALVNVLIAVLGLVSWAYVVVRRRGGDRGPH